MSADGSELTDLDGDVACKLPSADFISEGSSDDEAEGVFSRSTHIKSLGLFSEDGDLESDSLVDLEPNVSSEVIPAASEGQKGFGHNASEDGCGLKSWEDFKVEFDDVFRSCEEKVTYNRLHPAELSSGSNQSPAESAPGSGSMSSDLSRDLIIEMITSLHDSKDGSSNGHMVETGSTKERDEKWAWRPENATPASLDNGVTPRSDPAAPPTDAGVKSSPPSSSRGRRLLSLTTLETIQEHEIDRLLKSVESPTPLGTDSGVFSLTDSDGASPSSPHLKGVWHAKGAWGMRENGGSSDDLMKQLHQLSLTQADGHRGFGEDMSLPVLTGAGGGMSLPGETSAQKTAPHSRGDSEKPTVLIDVRHDMTTGPNREDSDDDDSDTQDDVYTWAQQRKMIKRNLTTPPISTPPTSTPHTSIPPTTTPPTTTPPTSTPPTTTPPTSTPPTTTPPTSTPPTTTPPTSTPPTTTPPTSTPHTSTPPISTTPISPSTSSTPPITPPTTIPLHTTLSPPTIIPLHTTLSPPTIIPLHTTLSPPTIIPLHITLSPPSTSCPSHSAAQPSHNLHHIHKVLPLHEPNKTTEPLEVNISPRKHNVLFRVDSLTSSVSDSKVTGQPKTTPTPSLESLTLSSSASDSKAAGQPNATPTPSSESPTLSSSVSDGEVAGRPKTTPTPRQRSSDSLTMSSSVSDGEVTSSEGASCSGDQESGKKEAKKGSGKKSKKQAKKLKKSQQKKTPPSKEKIERHQKRKAHIIQRIRNDSFNTSSDEENSLAACVVAVETESGGGAVIDTKKVQDDLQKMILSKKPPSYYETPATDPIYHENVSFGKQILDLNPSFGTTGLLTLSLVQHGLTALPFPASEEDTETLVAFHCLVLTWLTSQAASDCSTPLGDVGGAAVNPAPPLAELPFRITGLQQTVLDGQPSFLVAVHVAGGPTVAAAGRKGAPPPGSPSKADLAPDEVESFLASVTIGTVLNPLLSNQAISDAISPSVLSAMRLSFSQPLTTILGYQDDLSALSTPVSFYWNSIYHLSSLPSNESLKSSHSINTTVCTLNLGHAHLVYSVLQRAFSSGLDIAGARLLFGEQSRSVSFIESHHPPSSPGGPVAVGDTIPPTLALALRGPNAVYRWMEEVGPDDSALAKVTDPTSISALFGPGLVHAVRTPYQSSAALAKWFGGRACLRSGTIFGMSDARTKSERRKRQRVRFSGSESEDSISSPLPDVMFPPIVSNRPRLIAQAYVKSLLVVSPRVSPSCYGRVLASCDQLGFDVFGAKRMRLNAKRANVLEIPSEFVSHFTPSSTPPSPAILDPPTQSLFLGGVVMSLQAPPPLPSMIVIIGRENASVHSTSLKLAIVRSLQQVSCGPEVRGGANSIAHMIPYSEDKIKVLGSFVAPVCSGSSDFKVCGDGSDVDSNMREEVAFVAVAGVKSLPFCAHLLDTVFGIAQEHSSSKGFGHTTHGLTSSTSSSSSFSSDREDRACGGFEVVGLKIIPQLSRFHAKKLCPVPAGDPLYPQAIQHLSDKPASLLVFRGLCCNRRIFDRIKHFRSGGHMCGVEKRFPFIISRDLAEGVHFTNLFFSGKSLFSDSTSRKLTPYLPEAWVHEEDILQCFSQPKDTLFSVLLLPLASLTLVVKVLDRVSRAGFAFAGISALEVGSADTAEDGKFPGEGAVCIAVCLEKTNCVWLLQHHMEPFLGEGKERRVKCSQDFSCAISDLRRYFPAGVFAQEKGIVVKDYCIKTLQEDVFDGLSLPKECLDRLRPSFPIPYTSPLLERTVIILPPALFPQPSATPTVAGFVHVLEFLCKAKFDICGMKMVLFSADSVQELLTMLSLEKEVRTLTLLPSLVIVLERDNAASCFQLITKRSEYTKSLFHGHVDYMDTFRSEVIAPNDLKQAQQLLSFFHM